MTAKIRIKVGSMELEYEGDPSFLTDGIDALLTKIGDLSTRVPTHPNPAPATATTTINGGTPFNPDSFNVSTNTIAAHMDAKKGSELVISAMAQLELVQGKSSSGRAEILAEMKGATTYFNENMRKNMSSMLTSLTKSKRVNQIASDAYALSATEKQKVEAKVAEIR